MFRVRIYAPAERQVSQNWSVLLLCTACAERSIREMLLDPCYAACLNSFVEKCSSTDKTSMMAVVGRS